MQKHAERNIKLYIYTFFFSGSFNPVEIFGLKHTFEYVSPYALLKTLLQLVNLVSMFAGNQRMINLLIHSLLASFKTGLSEFCVVKFRAFFV